MSRRLLVLGWHNIEPTWSFSGTSPEAGRRGFDRQLRLLRRWANVVPLGSALADLAAGRALPPRAVALTFDDGYLDNATIAAPALRAAGLPATFFLVPDLLSGSGTAWWEDLGWAFAHATAREIRWDGHQLDTGDPEARRAALAVATSGLKTVDSTDRAAAVQELTQRLVPDGPPAARQFMDWPHAEDLLRQGFEVGSHTCSHPLLAHEAPDVQLRELVLSREVLQRELGAPVDVLAYPNGRAEDYTDATLSAVERAGYSFAVTTRSGLTGAATPAHEVRRVVVEPETDVRAVLLEAARAAKRALTRRAGRG